MYRLKSFFMRHWNKVVAAVCAIAIAVTTAVTSFVYAVDDTDTAPFLASHVVPANVDTWQSAPTNLRKLGEAFINTLRTTSANDFFGGLVDDIPTSMVKLITDTAMLYPYCIEPYDDVYYYLDDNGVLKIYDPNVISKSGHSGGAGRNRYVTDSEDFVFSGLYFKDRVDYWSDYYKPKDNVDQYTYSYQSASTKLDKSKRYAFTPYAPVYTDDGGAKTGWGFKSWSGGVYMLPYLVDDDSNGGFPYYSDLYYFIHSKRSSDGVLQIVVESYKLSDNSLVSTTIKDWDTSRLSLGLFWSGGTNILLMGYKSYFDYMGNTSSTQVCSASPSRYLYSGNVGNLTKVDTVSFLANNTGYDTFTPDVNIHDDWGFLVSAKPFDLWINQTDIDVSKIPDDYVITPVGDNIYNYTVTNKTGDTTTINNYITNNYNIPSSDKPDDGGNTGGGTSGNVTVGGDVNVKGDIGVNGSVDINVNVSGGSSSAPTLPSYDDYVNNLPEKNDTLSTYLKTAFDFLPPDILALVLGGVATAIICLIFKR